VGESRFTPHRLPSFPGRARCAGGAGPRATLPVVHWLFTGLLVGVSGATAVYTLWLVRRLFTTAPAPASASVSTEQPEVTP
jgi:hypothetical protein